MTGIAACTLYFSTKHHVVSRDRVFFIVDDSERNDWGNNGSSTAPCVRLRRLDCWPLTGAIPSEMQNGSEAAMARMRSRDFEKQGRASDGSSLERNKHEGHI